MPTLTRHAATLLAALALTTPATQALAQATEEKTQEPTDEQQLRKLQGQPAGSAEGPNPTATGGETQSPAPTGTGEAHQGHGAAPAKQPTN